MLKNILFDLDGTLLPMDQDCFLEAYFGLLAARIGPLGYEPKKLVEAVWSGTMEMIRNNGERTNEEIFWARFSAIFGERVFGDQAAFEDFYRTDFHQLRTVCGLNPKVPSLITKLRRSGLRLVLATNPIFPAIATETRMTWNGLAPSDFELYTTYENTAFCKPNPAYFTDILQKLGMRADETLMVGNDAEDDLSAAKAGISVFLVTDCLINKKERDLSPYPCGDFDALAAYIDSHR